MNKKTTRNDIGIHVRNPNLGWCVTKTFKCYELPREHGRIRIKIQCPFCEEISETTAWSFAGSGKRCENKECGAMFGFGNTAYKRKK